MPSVEVTLYTRRACHLCDVAKSAIRAAMSDHRLPMTLVEVDVDTNPDLRARYGNDVPVIHVNGREAFRHKVDSNAFAELVKKINSGLSSERCVPCHGGVPRLTRAEIEPLLSELDPAWQVIDDHHLEREFKFPDFVQALAFTNRAGAIAEEEQHHPDILLRWGSATVAIWTHAVDGLTRNDFVLAAKIDGAARG